MPAAIEIRTDTIIAVLATLLISGLVPSVLLLIKIGNDRAARAADRLAKLATEAAETNLLARTNRGNVKELWDERDDLHKQIASLNRSLQKHSQLLEAAQPPDPTPPEKS
jgi:hypothetical protein